MRIDSGRFVRLAFWIFRLTPPSFTFDCPHLYWFNNNNELWAERGMWFFQFRMIFSLCGSCVSHIHSISYSCWWHFKILNLEWDLLHEAINYFDWPQRSKSMICFYFVVRSSFVDILNTHPSAVSDSVIHVIGRFDRNDKTDQQNGRNLHNFVRCET